MHELGLSSPLHQNPVMCSNVRTRSHYSQNHSSIAAAPLEAHPLFCSFDLLPPAAQGSPLVSTSPVLHDHTRLVGNSSRHGPETLVPYQQTSLNRQLLPLSNASHSFSGKVMRLQHGEVGRDELGNSGCSTLAAAQRKDHRHAAWLHCYLPAMSAPDLSGGRSCCRCRRAQKVQQRMMRGK